MTPKDWTVVVLGVLILTNLGLLFILKSLRLLERWGRVYFNLHIVGNVGTYVSEVAAEDISIDGEEEQGEYTDQDLIEPETLETFVGCVFWYRLCYTLGLIILGIHWVVYQKFLDLRDLFEVFTLDAKRNMH